MLHELSDKLCLLLDEELQAIATHKYEQLKDINSSVSLLYPKRDGCENHYFDTDINFTLLKEGLQIKRNILKQGSERAI